MISAKLGQWILQSELGRGGMGCVYLAHDDQGNQAAVKVLAAELSTHPAAVTRFQREIEVLRRLDHPNIVHFYESGSYQGCLYFVMEYIDGQDFADLLLERRRLPWPEVLEMAVQVCAALKQAHNQGIIHRDLKPSNLLRKADGQIKLTDFGVAHVFASDHLTRTGTVVGTAEYLSPEQAVGKPATKRSDLYSLGVVLYTLLAGRTPFQGSTVPELLHKHCYALFAPLDKLIPDLPHDVAAIVSELLDKDPERRPPDAGVLQKRLRVLGRKLKHRSEPTRAAIAAEPTQAENTVPSSANRPVRREGPATMISRLVRQELGAQLHGGPLKQFLNRPVVLATLFVLCLGGLVWAFWPPSPESLFRKGQALMEAEPSRPEEAWEYFEPLQRKYPDNPYKEKVAEYQQQLEEYRAQRAQARQKLSGEPLGEAQWFYYQGLRQRQQGNEAVARATWENLIHAFQEIPAEKVWVKRAQEQLTREVGVSAHDSHLASLHAAIAQARRLREEGHPDQAQKILAGLEHLYQNDPSARDLLEGERQRARGE